MRPIAKNIYKIGIDPGKITGLAISVNGKLERLISSTFWDAYDLVIDEYHARRKVVSVIIEVPKTKANWHGAGASHNVGRVCRESELLADGLERHGLNVTRVHPQGKVKHSYFCQITGWRGKTNQHKRDAAMLIFDNHKK